MASSDGTDTNATIDSSRRSIVGRWRRQSGAPIARAPLTRDDAGTTRTPAADSLGDRRSPATEPAFAEPLFRDEYGVPGGRRSRAFPEDPAELEPPNPRQALTVVDGDDAEDESGEGVSIDPATATTLGDFAAAMAGPLAAAAFARSFAVFFGAALFVLLIRSQGRRSALSDSEIGAMTPVAAAGAAAALTFAVQPGDGAVHAFSAALVALGTGLAATLLLRAIVDRFVHTRVAVIGDAATAHDLAWQLSAAGNRRFTVLGYVTRTAERDNLRDLAHVSFRVRRLGLVSDLSHIVARNDIDLLVMGSVDDRLKVFERAAVCAERYRTRLISLTAFEEAVFRRVPLDHLNVAWFQHVMHPRFKPAPRWITRGADVCFALVVGLLTLPAWAPTALFMRLAFGSPVLVHRRRVGERGRTIAIHRFRVARRDVTGDAPDEDEPAVGFGRFLRSTGIERLPGLLNLLRGDITLVGPRPDRPQRFAELDREVQFYGRRNMLTPGITGWAQIHRPADPRSELSNDLFYLKHQSLMLYVYVLLASLRRPLARRGPSPAATTSN
jgi:lipopolysaccharide/colanic/teichoic acid biosynthesis glycosyltransferase